jgi:hypothetical protein
VARDLWYNLNAASKRLVADQFVADHGLHAVATDHRIGGVPVAFAVDRGRLPAVVFHVHDMDGGMEGDQG